MAEQQTCGQGLAENSALPGKLAELTGAVATILEVHMKALDLEDNDSRIEHEAYRELASDHRRIAAGLGEIARRMSGYRDLPMGRHDPKVMSSPKAVEAFDELVSREAELLALLETRLERDREMRARMRSAGS